MGNSLVEFDRLSFNVDVNGSLEGSGFIQCYCGQVDKRKVDFICCPSIGSTNPWQTKLKSWQLQTNSTWIHNIANEVIVWREQYFSEE